MLNVQQAQRIILSIRSKDGAAPFSCVMQCPLELGLIIVTTYSGPLGQDNNASSLRG